MGHGRLSLALWAACAPAAAAAQAVVTSPGPERVAVTVYRDPDRGADEAFSLEWLNGFALISETRRVVLPAGEAELRFEGVAGGIIPQSAIVTGLPGGTVERNRDAYLLSPESLLDRSLGRRVHLRRTVHATGRVTETDAVVLSGADGAVVVRTPEGAEALRCTGLNEQLVYSGVPSGLSARPTLSVRSRAAEPVTATVTLSYLASGFDWQANYIANLSDDGERVDLFAWLTMANGDETGFANAETQAVAGRLNREEGEAGNENENDGDGALVLQCWPSGTTSDFTLPDLTAGAPVVNVPSEEIRLQGTTQTEDLINALPQAFAGMRARQEELGDLKLYRIPEPVTVAARSQKQVAFLVQPGVLIRFAYRHRLDADAVGQVEPPLRLLRTRNRREDGLGLPLPAGTVQLFAEGAGRPILLGEGALGDYAVNEDVEIELGGAIAV
ncbi:MAG TPA: hypothetical protein VLK25_05220, partial [Allosphingosinicella sp.]|nr:hypothetical protein [Allosphingosinicella sp.]